MGSNAKKVKKTYSAEEVTKKLKLNKKDLGFFEKEGVFEYADRSKKKIDPANFDRLKAAATLQKELGVNREGISVIIHMRDKMRRMQRDFDGFLRDVRRRLGVKLITNLKRIEDKDAN